MLKQLIDAFKGVKTWKFFEKFCGRTEIDGPLGKYEFHNNQQSFEIPDHTQPKMLTNLLTFLEVHLQAGN